MRKTVCAVIALCFALFLSRAADVQAQDLSLSTNDLWIEMRPEGGYHLFIRYKPDISSVLLTESTRDPRFRSENYAYRVAEKNEINGSEIRLIDGYPIPPESRIYSLVSSTPKWHHRLGWVYHIYIPFTLYYGYENGRHGEVQVGDGTYLNVRTFYYAYADYRGPFRDNPFTLRVVQESRSAETPPSYLKETVDAFSEIAGENVVYSKGPADLPGLIGAILEKEKGKTVDIVVCVDATNSMKPHIDEVRAGLIPILDSIISDFPAFRIGMVLYKDYKDEYLNKIFPFTESFSAFQRDLNNVRVYGGGDIPEAVYEALHAGLTKFPWEAESRIIILVGDAPPHPLPRGKITKQMVETAVREKGVKVNAIILPE